MLERTARLQQDDIGPAGAVGELLRESGAYRQIGPLSWWRAGIGWYPVSPTVSPYDQAYFDRFEHQARTSIGGALMRERVAFVARHYRGMLCDIGIGSGAFIRARSGQTVGWDINPAGLRWLENRKHSLIFDPYLTPSRAMSLWDVLEHMHDFTPLLSNCREWLFLSLPIFRDAEHARKSKHFRPDEHVWYFTRGGLTWLMNRLDFELIECNDEETRLGREDIMSFAFRRHG